MHPKVLFSIEIYLIYYDTYNWFMTTAMNNVSFRLDVMKISHNHRQYILSLNAAPPVV